MKNSYKEEYPRAWQDWHQYSKSEEIEFTVFDTWCSNNGFSVKIIEYPDSYEAFIEQNEKEFNIGTFNEWFEALDAIVEDIFKRVEYNYEEIEDMISLVEVSKVLDGNPIEKEDVIKILKNYIDEISLNTNMIREDLHDKIFNQKTMDNFDAIIMLSLSCKRIITS
jgi:hypothetical protein